MPEEITPEERIRQLQSLGAAKKKELESKKEEFEKKKKELEELEEQSKKEIASAEDAIRKKIDELAFEEQEMLSQIEKESKKRKAEEIKSLEAALESENIREDLPPLRGYGDAIQNIMRGEPRFYDLTNYNVLNELERIANSAKGRDLSRNEKEFIELVQYHAEKMNANNEYNSRDESNYLSRELGEIDRINRLARKTKMDSTKGNYQL